MTVTMTMSIREMVFTALRNSGIRRNSRDYLDYEQGKQIIKGMPGDYDEKVEIVVEYTGV